jgi:pristinamycin I synthase-3/4
MPSPQAPDAYVDHALASARAFWMEALVPSPRLDRLPIDGSGDAVPRDASIDAALDDDTAARLRRASRGTDGLAFVWLVSALAIVLRRYWQTDDLMVATGVNARGAAWSPNAWLPLRIGMPATTQHVSDLLARVRTGLQQVYTHQKYPLQRLDNVWRRPPVPGVLIRCVQISGAAAAADADLDVCWDIGDARVSLRIAYAAARYRESTLQLLAHQQFRALARILDRRDAALADVDFTDDADRAMRRCVGAADVVDAVDVVDRLRQQVATTPDRIAVACGDRSLTYAEFSGAVNRMASWLAPNGVGPDTRVAICLDHGIDLIVAIWATLSCGAAYVPCDPTHPPARLLAMLDDAAPVMTITSAARAPLLEGYRGDVRFVGDAPPVGTGAGTAAVTRSGGLAMASAGPRRPPILSAAPAYVIYTSGSTGRPKGVVVSRSALAHYVAWASQVYVGDGASSVAVHSSIAFDLTVTSVFVPLVCGHRIVMYPERHGHPALFDVMRANDVEVVKLTPSHLALVRDQPWRGSRVRTLIVGGEALSTALARDIHDALGGRSAIYNEYGPTEATVGCMLHRFDPTDPRAWVPIGVPAPGMGLAVLDRRGQPVPRGVPGRLYLEGPQLADGYWHRPDLTAARFRPSPWGDGARLYDSGDLARWLPDGPLEYLGRQDQQIKVRGVRIELEEVRATLAAHPAVRSAVVLHRSIGDASEPEPVAYYVSRTELPADELRTFLARTLVSEAIPRVLMHLNCMPLTVNGKIDLDGLPAPVAPAGTTTSAAGAGAPPSRQHESPIEDIVLRAWQQVLGVPSLQRTDNFFQAGGHSLLATRAAARVRAMVGVDVPVRDVFDHPTAAAFADRVRASLRGPVVDEPVLQRADRRELLPLSFAQQRLWFLDRLDPGTSAHNVPLIVRLAGRLDYRAAIVSLTMLVRRHESLRTSFPMHGVEPVQVIGLPGPVALPIVDLSAMRDADVGEAFARELARQQAITCFDLQTGPLFQAMLIALASDVHVLCVTVHHIVCDGASLGILLRDFTACYAALSAGIPPTLPAPAFQYVDFTSWQRQWLAGCVLDLHLDYWRRVLADLSDCALPFDRPWPIKPTHAVGRWPVSVPAQTTDALQAVAADHDVTLFMLVLAACQVVVGHVAHQDDVAIGVTIANRTRVETEEIVGFFANTLVLRARIDPHATVREYLARARESTLGAYAHQDLPFEMLVKALAPDRYLGRSPLFLVKLVFQDRPIDGATLPGVSSTVVPSGKGALRSPITITLDRTPHGLDGSIDYSADLFDADTVRQVRDALVDCLAALAERIDTIGALQARLARAGAVADEARAREVLTSRARVWEVPGVGAARVAREAGRTHDGHIHSA